MNQREYYSNFLDKRYFEGVCHRGRHDKKTISENGMFAFKKAKENNFAFECDIHLTKDNQLVVVHDSELKRVTGKEGIVENLTLKEIQENFPLVIDGSTIPSFEELLNFVNFEVPMVVELKVYNKNYKELAQKTREILDKYLKVDGKLDEEKAKKIMLISFDPRALLPFRKYGLFLELLLAESHLYVRHFRHLFPSIDVEYTLLETKWVKNYRKKHLVNCWTIDTDEKLNKVKDKADFITYEIIDLK